MTINLSTPVKYISSIALTVLLTAGTMYAIDITNLSQTATTGDKVTASWVNAVNESVGATTRGLPTCIAITSKAECIELNKYGTPHSFIYIAPHNYTYKSHNCEDDSIQFVGPSSIEFTAMYHATPKFCY